MLTPKYAFEVIAKVVALPPGVQWHGQTGVGKVGKLVLGNIIRSSIVRDNNCNKERIKQLDPQNKVIFKAEYLEGAI